MIFMLCVLGCGPAPTANNANNSNAKTAGTPGTAKDTITIAERPQKIRDLMDARGTQDEAHPTLTIVRPIENSTIGGSTVRVKLTLAGDLRGYKPMMDETTHTGNHIHVILDNQPYEAYYNLDEPFELRNIADGDHTLSVFASRPWHEGYKTPGAFNIVKFKVKGGGANPNAPATTNSGQPMSNTNTAAKHEGKDMQPSNAGPVDLTKPLLTYSRPKGEYKGADADAIMLDFWLANAKLSMAGGEYRVRYSIDGGEAKYIEQWWPIWLSGLATGKHTIKLDLVDKDDNLVDNGGYNSTTREFTVTR